MIDKGVAKRYATALFGAAQGAGTVDPVLADLEALEKLVREDARLLRFLSSPRELDENKEALVRKLFEGRTNDLLVRLLLLLLRKGRVLHLLDVIEAYRGLVEELKGVATAKVVTAVQLEDDLRQRLIRELERISGKTIRLQPSIDPAIIGGLVVLLEGKIYDRSIRHGFELLEADLMSVRVH